MSVTSIMVLQITSFSYPLVSQVILFMVKNDLTCESNWFIAANVVVLKNLSVAKVKSSAEAL